MIKFEDKILLIGMLIVAAYFDIKTRKIPNRLTIPVVVWGIMSSCFFEGLGGAISSLLGFLSGLGIFIVPFLLGGMGAGDVKLMAAVGSLMGWKLTVFSALITGIVGGIIVIGYTIYKGIFFRTIKNIGMSSYKVILYVAYHVTHKDTIMNKYLNIHAESINNEKVYIPYGVAIAVGTLIVLAGNHFGYPPFI